MQTKTINWIIIGIFIAIAIFTSIAGLVFNLYSQWTWFDEVLHAYDIFAVTLLVAVPAYGKVLTGRRDHSLLLVLVIIGIGLGIGALWEIFEWTYDHLTNPQSVIKGKTDTIIDLILDICGALIAGLLSLWMVGGSQREGV